MDDLNESEVTLAVIGREEDIGVGTESKNAKKRSPANRSRTSDLKITVILHLQSSALPTELSRARSESFRDWKLGDRSDVESNNGESPLAVCVSSYTMQHVR